MKTLAVYNMKGGVGKTAAAVNLAYLAGQYGRRTLLWDLDPQGAATWYLGLEPGIRDNVKKLARGKRDWAESIQATAWKNLHCLPADFEHRNLDQYLRKAEHPAFQVRKLIKSFGHDFDVIVLDCPPSFSTVTENLFRAADLIVVPIIPSQLSLRSLEQMLHFLREERIKGLQVHPFFSMVDQRRRIHREAQEDLRKSVPDVLTTAIPYAADVERMGQYRAPLGAVLPRSPATKAFEQLWLEIAERLHRS